MNRFSIFLALGAALLWFGFVPMVQADTVPASIDRGKALFNDTKLANNTTGLSCNSCHPGGGTTGGTVDVMGMKMKIPAVKGAAARFPAVKGPDKKVITLAQMDNMCIVTFLKGQALDLNSQEAVDLVSYIASISEGTTFKLRK